MRCFVVIGQKATASADFSLSDIPGTSGRLDVLLRCIRAALLLSHELRRDTVVYLVLQGGPRAPRTVRIDGRAIRFVRPDERCLASMVQKALLHTQGGPGFVPSRDGLAVAEGGLEAVLPELLGADAYVLDERGEDVRDGALDARAASTDGAGEDNRVFFVGCHLGFDDRTREAVFARSKATLSVSPLGVHADDAITLLHNELDRRAAPARATRAGAALTGT